MYKKRLVFYIRIWLIYIIFMQWRSIESFQPRSIKTLRSIQSKLHVIEKHQYYASIEEKSTDQANQLDRVWINQLGEISSSTTIQDDQVKIVSYNCLGPLHAESIKHNYAPVHIRKWTRRRNMLLQELRLMNADIFCLQEVSQKSLKESYIPGLKHIGLECCGFAPMKSSEESGINGHKHVGCAIFVRADKIELIASKRIHLRDFNQQQLSRSQSTTFVADIRSKWNSMVVMEARIVATNQSFVVANTHIYWNPYRPDIKIFQIAAAMDAIHAFNKEAGYEKGAEPPIVLCGDFNSVPTRTQSISTFDPYNSIDDISLAVGHNDVDPSAMSLLLERGKLASSHPEHPDTFYSKILDGRPNPTIGDLQAGMQLRNIYSLPAYASRKPLFTTKTDDFQGWIDHIWINNRIHVDMV